MMAPRAQASSSVLLASAALLSLSAAAQPELTPTSEAEREIAITGAADEPPVVVYGAPDWPLMVSFDAPLRKDTAVTVQGADVRPHPFHPDTLVIMPSKLLAAQRSLPALVPLEEGAVALTIAFSPPRRDASVRIVRRANSDPPAMTTVERQELLSLAAKPAVETCANADATAVPRRIEQSNNRRMPGGPLVCGGGAFVYMRIMATADCAPEAARLSRGEESTEVVLLQQSTQPCSRGTCWLVVARTPQGDGRGFTLELLAKDGVPCQSNLVDLKPPSP